MCSHKEITWRVVHNNVACRMIDNSLTHKFMPSQKIRKRTKIINAEIKKRGIIKNYDQYMALRSSVIHKIPDDYSTDDTDNLSDVDYSIIHSSQSKLTQYRIKNSISRAFTSDEEEEVSHTIKKMKSDTIKSIERRTKKSVDIRQQKNYISQVCISNNKDDNDNGTCETMWKTKKNSKTKPVKRNTKKPVNIKRPENLNSQALFTSDENDNEKESQMIQKRKNNSKAKSVGKNKKSVNTGWRQNGISQTLRTNDESDEEKSHIIRQKTKKNSKAKPVEKKTKKSVNIGWQEVVKKDRRTTLVSDKRQHTDTLNISEQNISQSDKCDDLKANSNKKSLLPTLEFQDNVVSRTTKSENEDMPPNYSNPTAVIPESDSSPNSEPVSQDNVLHDTMQNHENSEAAMSRSNSELNGQINAIVCETDPEEKVTINREDDSIQRESNVIMDKSNYSWSLEISSNDEMHKSKLDTSKIQSSSINDPPSSISKRGLSVSDSEKNRSCDKLIKTKKESSMSCEKLIKMEEKSSLNAKNDDTFASPKSCGLINNAKRNLTSILDTVDCTHQVSSPDASHDQEKDSGIDEDSQDKLVKPVKTENQDKVEDIVEKISVSPEPAETDKVAEEVQEDCIKDSLKVDDEILKEQDVTDDTEAKKLETDSPEINQIKEEDTKINSGTKTLEDSCNDQKKQQQPKVMSTEIVNKKYKIVCKRDNDSNVTKDIECNPSKPYTSTSCPNAISDDVDDISAKTTDEMPVAQKVEQKEDEEDEEVEHEEDEIEHEEEEENNTNVARCMSPQMKKRLQQLNLTVDSDSSDSENENGYRSIVGRGSRSHIDNFDANHLSTRDETHRNDVPEEIDNAALPNDDTREDAHAEFGNDEENSVFEESDAETSHNEDTREEVHAQRETQDKDNVNREKRSGNSEGSYASEERHNRSVLSNSKIVDNEDDQHQENIRYRPCNLEELIEDQELLVKTLPASLTLADISKDEEAFILNIPNKVLQCNLQGQPLILKEKTIHFGKNKFRVMRNKVNTLSCVFATGKQRKPYKIVNLKEISTITIRERLSRPTKDAVEPNSDDVNIFYKKKSRKRRYTSK